MITRPLENTVLLHASICVPPLEVFFVQALYVSSCSCPERGASCKRPPLPCGASPFRQSPAHIAPPLHPSLSQGLQGDGTPAAVLRAPGTVSHNWHCAIITSHHSNPCLPLLMSYSGPTSVTAVWASERERTHWLMNSLVGKQDSESQLFQPADVAQRWA